MKHFFTFAATLLCAATLMAQTPQTEVEADCGDQVTITAEPEPGYHFVRWDDDNTNPVRLVDVTGDRTYYAYFAINQYTITFKNWNDTVLQTAVYNHGDVVSVPIPTKTGDAQYTYTFDHWTPNVNYTAEADAEYTAVFTSTVNKYTITFKNWDGGILEAKEWEYGAIPSYTGTPTRPADAENTYTFSGWDHSISSVTGEDTYIAQFNGAKNSYTLTVSGEHGTTTGSGTFQYGTTQPITATPDACYHFVQWSNGDTNASTTILIEGPTSVTAIFEKDKYTIRVESDNETQGKVKVTK